MTRTFPVLLGALSLGMLAGGGMPLRAQRTVARPAITKKASPVPRAVLRKPIERVVTPMPPIDSQPYATSLLVSLDGAHWSTSDTIQYVNPCGTNIPSACGASVPHLKVYLFWHNTLSVGELNPVGARSGGGPAQSYFAIRPPDYGNDSKCSDPAADWWAWGGKDTHSWEGAPIVPNTGSGTTYACHWRVRAQTVHVNSNGTGTPADRFTNWVTVVVRVVPGES